MLRASSLRQIPQVIMVCCTIWLVYRRVTSPRPQPIAGIVAYLISCGLILVLFWPEAAPRFLTVRTMIPAGGVTSFIAVQNGMANVNARSSGLVPRQLLSGTGQAQVPQALDLILRAVTEMPLLLGDAIYPGLNRPFSRVGSAQRVCRSGRDESPGLPEDPHAELRRGVLHAGPRATAQEQAGADFRGEDAVELGRVGTSCRHPDSGQARRRRRLRDGADGDAHDLPGLLSRYGKRHAAAPARTANRTGLEQGAGGARQPGHHRQGAGPHVRRPRDGAADGDGCRDPSAW